MAKLINSIEPTSASTLDEPRAVSPQQAGYVATFLTSYIYVFSEWLFLVTKPSLFSTLPFWKSLLILGSVSLTIAACALLLQMTLETLLAYGRKMGRINKTFAPSLVISALISGFISWLLFDNFTTVLFHFGVAKAENNPARAAYLILLIILVAYWLRVLQGEFKKMSASTFRLLRNAACGLAIVSTVALMIRIEQSFTISEVTLHLKAQDGKTPAQAPLPNILFLSSDGIDAREMSVYGYPRETTPFLTEFSKHSVLFENAFSNSSNTYSSLISTLNGRLPTDSNVLAFPDILVGAKAYEHLPAILRSLGYSTLQMTMRFYADAADANMRYGFQDANLRNLDETLAEVLISKGYPIPLADHQFLSRIMTRARLRLDSLFGINLMENPAAAFTRSGMEQFLLAARDQDPQRISEFLKFANDSTHLPWFAQIHLLGTHCCGFNPPTRRYSAGETQDPSKFQDFYDDAILQADQYFEQIIKGLEESHQLDHTLVVISSDHGDHWLVRERVPLIIRFPKEQYHGVVHENVQLIDLAPTVLDLLGFVPPPWMSGTTLIPGHAKLDPMRPIVSLAGFVDTPSSEKNQTLISTEHSAPGLNVVLCNKWFTLIPSERKIIDGDVLEHTSPCQTSRLEAFTQASKILNQTVRQH